MGEERPVQRCKEKMVVVAAEGNVINSNVNELVNEMWSYRVISTGFEIAWKESRKRQKTRVRDLKSVRKAEKVELLTSSAVSRKSKLRPRGHPDTRQTTHAPYTGSHVSADTLILFSSWGWRNRAENRKAAATYLNSFWLIRGIKRDSKEEALQNHAFVVTTLAAILYLNKKLGVGSARLWDILYGCKRLRNGAGINWEVKPQLL